MEASIPEMAQLSTSWSTDEGSDREWSRMPACLSRLFARFFPDLDLSAVGTMWSLFWPTFMALLFQYTITLVSVAFCSHLGVNQLGSVGLANSVIIITGIAVISGIAGAGDTLGAQAFGANKYQKVSIILHKGVVILGLACFPVWAIWVNIDSLLILIKQPKEVAHGAWLYLMVFSPGVIAMALFRLVRSYVQVQGIVKPVAITCFCTFILNVLANYVFIYPLNLGTAGAAVAAALTYFFMVLILILYIYFSKVYVLTWVKPSAACLEDWGRYIQLGLSGMAGELLLFSGNEIAIFLMGIVGKAELGAQTILFQIRTVLAMISVGIGIILCIMTGRELGAGCPSRAKQVVKLGTVMSMVINGLLSLVLIGCKDTIGLLFTKDDKVLARIREAMPYVILNFFCFSESNCFGGVLLGCAKQKVFTFLFFVSCYVVGLPIGTVLTFVKKMGIVGMWIGMATGMFVQFVLSIVYVYFILDFKAASEVAKKDSGEVTFTKDSMKITYGSFACSSQEEKAQYKEISNFQQERVVFFRDKAACKRLCFVFFCVTVLLISILIKIS